MIDLHMSPESTDNMNLSGDINLKQLHIINKKRNRKQITKTDLTSFTLIHPSPEKQSQDKALLNLFHYQMKVHVHS